ncbi:MAG TPA: bifunctional biotin--[acetyl-CoA-carboxylase] ligase/biotin operon repressor BirA [Lysobacter sp.]|nr:bifunctional biotin--[acetyl-CoA-carboxylase] ligase/biotin operon repressor BirA [Lysobacter sp.]
MSAHDERALLARLIAGPVSGDALAQAGGHTRAAVWKRIEALREAGVAIEARPGRGYALARPVELLDADAIRASLPAPAAAALAALEVAWTLDSTNTELLRRPLPVRGAHVLLAERQTGGRGRRGRAWASPLAANLYLSVARLFDGGLARLGGLSLVAGLAVAEALHALGHAEVRLKWPNDLVVERDGALRKLGGLLIEGGGEHAGPVRAVIGIGLNVRMPDDVARAIDQPWIDLATLAASPSRNAVAAAVIAHLLPMLETFDVEGLHGFLPRYAALDALRGRALDVQTGAHVRVARALGIAEDGGLQVEYDDGGRDVLHAGEVTVRRQ